MERKGYIILIVCCAVGLALITWASMVQARAAKNLETAIRTGRIKVEITGQPQPSSN